MKYIILTMVITGCATTVEDKEWRDIYDSEDWRKQFNDCQDFLYMDNDAWHWCMQSRRYDMTQYEDKVAEQKEKLKEQQDDSKVLSLETRYANGKWTEQTIRYKSGKTITEFSDKRKSTLIEEFKS